MAQRNIRVGIKMSYVDEYGNIADNGDTLYYGEYEVDPDEGLRYTYVKAPDGHFDILRTENTDIAKEMIDKIVEVGLKDSTNYSPKLTFILQFDEQDRVSTWNDRIEDLFKKEFANLYPDLKPTIMQVKSYDIKRAILMPFYNEKAVVTDFELTPGRTTRNVGQLTVELFRRLMDETLKFLDQFLEILNEGFNSLDDLKMVDMKQDVQLGDISAAANSWELICELIRKWIKDTMDKFKMLHKKFTVDLTNYRSNLMCAIKLFSTNERDNPFIESQFFTPEKSVVSLLTTSKGITLDMKINKGNTNEVLPVLNQNASVRLKGGNKYTVFCSAETLEYQVMSTENIPTIKPSYNNTRVVPGDHYEPDFHTWVGSDPVKLPWHLTLRGGFGDKGVVGYVYNYLWRSNNYNSWGAGAGGNNTNCLQQNKDIGEFKNTRIDFTMNMPISEIRRRFKQLTIYTDGWYGMTSMNGSGGIQNYRDGSGRCSYNGYGTWANNEASIPADKIKIPLRMTQESETVGCAGKITVDTDALKDDGSWLLVYSSPTGGSWYGHTIEHMRRKGRAFGCMSWKYYIRVKDPNTIELLVNYIQFIDGDSGNNVQTQSAGRTSALITGEKKTDAILVVDKAFTNSANNIKTNPGSDKISKNYQYTDNIIAFDKTVTYDITKLPNAVITIACKANFQFQESIDHKGTCHSSSSLVYGNLKKWNTRGWDDRTGGGPQVPAASDCGLVDVTDQTSIMDTAEVVVKYQPDVDVTDRLVKQIVLNRPFNERDQSFQIYATVTNNGNNRTVRIWARFYAPSGNSHRRNSRISFSCSGGFLIEPGGDGVSAPLVENRPSGKSLEIYDYIMKRALYAALSGGGQSNFIYGEHKQRVDQWGGGTISRGWDQIISIGSSEDVTIGVNANFDIRRSRDHSGTCWAETWGVYGNLTSTNKSYWSDSSGGGPMPPNQSAPPEIQRDTLAGLNACQVSISINRRNLTSDYKEIFSKTFVGNITAYFKVKARLESGTKLGLSFRFETGGLGNGRDGGKIAYFAYYGVACRNPSRKTLSVTDMQDNQEYKLPDIGDDISPTALSMNTFRMAKFNNTENINSKLDISSVSSLTLILFDGNYKIGINMSLGTLFSKLVRHEEEKEESNFISSKGKLVVGQDGELYILEDKNINKVNRNVSVNDYLSSFDNAKFTEINITDDNTPDSNEMFSVDKYTDILNIVKNDIRINSNVKFEAVKSTSDFDIDEPIQPSKADIKSNDADMIFTINPRHLDNLWYHLFDLKPIKYKTNSLNTESTLSCFARIDDNNLQLGWRINNKSNDSSKYIQTTKMKWKYNIVEVINE